MATSLPSLRDSKVNARSEVEIGSRSERAERKGGVKGRSERGQFRLETEDRGKEISEYRSQDTARARAGCDGMNKFPGGPSCKVN